jgi:hypothetical protein
MDPQEKRPGVAQQPAAGRAGLLDAGQCLQLRQVLRRGWGWCRTGLTSLTDCTGGASSAERGRAREDQREAQPQYAAVRCPLDPFADSHTG